MGQPMFEIYKRHTPMFVTSEIRKLAEIFTDTLKFKNANLSENGIEVIDIFKTVRINENNQFIVKSKLGAEEITKILKNNTAPSIDDLIKNMAAHLAIDSYIYIGKNASAISSLEKTLPKATKNSKKTLVVFDSPNEPFPELPETKWYDMDHIALWIGSDWIKTMDGTEAFFAMSPAFKLEVELNRYQPLTSLGDFAVGMVRF